MNDSEAVADIKEDVRLYKSHLEGLLALELTDLLPHYEEKMGHAIAEAMMLAYEGHELSS